MGGFWAGQTALISAGLATPPRADTTPLLGRRLRFRGPGGPLCTLVRADGTQICAAVPSTASYLPLCWPLPIGVSCWWINYRGGRRQKDWRTGTTQNGLESLGHPPG